MKVQCTSVEVVKGDDKKTYVCRYVFNVSQSDEMVTGDVYFAGKILKYGKMDEYVIGDSYEMKAEIKKAQA